MAELRIGLVDSGHALPAAQVAAAQAFALSALGVQTLPLREDALGHGSAVAAVIAARAPAAKLCVAQVFDQRGLTSALQVAAAIDWLVGCGVRLINLSLGVREDRPALREACRAALEAGVLLCASNPAQGASVYPAAYPGVWRVTGDARCLPQQWSWLATAQADFGGCVRSRDARLAGSSLGCAAVSGHIAGYLQAYPQARAEQVRDWLHRHASYHGREFKVGG